MAKHQPTSPVSPSAPEETSAGAIPSAVEADAAAAAAAQVEAEANAAAAAAAAQVEAEANAAAAAAALAQAAAAPVETADDRLDVFVPQAFTLNTDDGKTLPFAKGAGKMTQAQLDHWFVKNMGVRLAAG